MTFHIGIPQLLYIILAVIGLLITAANHGYPKKGKDDIWTATIATILVFLLLLWGGFFK